jgi:hypothetical protein
MGFFEALPRPEPTEPSERPTRPRPPWLKPDVVLPGVVAVERILGRSDDAVVAVGAIAAYPNGFEFTLAAILRVERRGAVLPHLHALDPDDPVPDRFLRLGVEFSDGRRATNLPSMPPADPISEPARPMLMPRGGGGGPRRNDATYWVFPLPPPGPLALVCEWPAYGIGESRVELDAALILDASTRAVRLWPDDPDESSEGPIATLYR